MNKDEQLIEIKKYLELKDKPFLRNFDNVKVVLKYIYVAQIQNTDNYQIECTSRIDEYSGMTDEISHFLKHHTLISK